MSQETPCKTEFNRLGIVVVIIILFKEKKEVLKSQHGAREEPNKLLKEELGFISSLEKLQLSVSDVQCSIKTKRNNL